VRSLSKEVSGKHDPAHHGQREMELGAPPSLGLRKVLGQCGERHTVTPAGKCPALHMIETELSLELLIQGVPSSDA
jgi:hypothetical protein